MRQASYTLLEEVMFFDTDIGGVIHNLAYLRMIEKARTLLCTETMEMDLCDMTKSGIYPVLLRTEVDYKRPGTLGDHIQITSSLEKLENAKFWVQSEVRLKSNNTLLVSSRQSLALVKMPDAKPTRLPKSWKEKWS